MAAEFPSLEFAGDSEMITDESLPRLREKVERQRRELEEMQRAIAAMTNDHKLAKRAHKLGYRYITRWPVPTIGTEHILEHKRR